MALLNSGNKVNAIHLSFIKKLGLFIRLIDIEAQKIDGTMLNTYGMVVIAFLMINKANQVRFFEEIFLEANICPKIVFRMIFFTLSSTNVDFLD